MGRYRIIIVLFACLLSSFLAFSTLWLHPSETLGSNGGDGIKNYYTPIWYALHDSSAHFTGMLYPYGDNYVFADAQPLLASALGWYHNHVQPLSGYDMVAVLNLAMLFGVVLCALLMYQLLRENNLPWLYSLVAAIVITLMSPQIERFHGHYGLSYMFAVPLVWLLSHYVFTRKHFVVWAILLTLTLVTLEFLHVYYLFVCGMFAALYGGFGLLMNLKQWRGHILRAGAIVASVVVSFLFFQLWLAATSSVDDRVVIPFGISTYKANFQSLFLPSYKPLIFGKLANGEGRAYVGFMGLPIIGYFIFKFSGYIIARRYKSIARLALPAPLQTAVWPSVAIMLLSTGFPLVMLLDWLPDGAKQFRSLGRFAWVFYYVYTALCAFTLYQLYRYLALKNARKIGLYLLIMAMAIWVYETMIYLRPIQKTLAAHYKYNTAQSLFENDVLEEEIVKGGWDKGKFQAIIPLPYYLAGSEKLVTNVNGDIFHISLQTSLRLGVPITAASISRSSVAHTGNMFQLFASPLIEREVLQDFNGDERPFLIIHNGLPLSIGEQQMLQRATLLFTSGKVSYYSLPYQALQPTQVDYYAQFQLAKDSLLILNDYRVSQPGFYYENTFDNEPNQLGMYGSGALVSERDTIWLARGMEIPPSEDTLQASYWIEIEPARYDIGRVFGTVRNQNGEQRIEIDPSTSWDVYQGWLRVAVNLYPSKSPSKLDLILKGPKLTADQFVVKPLHAHMYKSTSYGGDTVMYNNYFIYP